MKHKILERRLGRVHIIRLLDASFRVQRQRNVLGDFVSNLVAKSECLLVDINLGLETASLSPVSVLTSTRQISPYPPALPPLPERNSRRELVVALRRPLSLVLRRRDELRLHFDWRIDAWCGRVHSK